MWYDSYLDLNLQLCARIAPGSCHGVGLGLMVLGFNGTSTLVGHFMLSPREREKRDRRNSRGDERERQGRKKKVNESEETEKIKH